MGAIALRELYLALTCFWASGKSPAAQAEARAAAFPSELGTESGAEEASDRIQDRYHRFRDRFAEAPGTNTARIHRELVLFRGSCATARQDPSPANLTALVKAIENALGASLAAYGNTPQTAELRNEITAALPAVIDAARATEATPLSVRALVPTRRLAAILAADVVGYSRLIGADEAGTLQGLRTLRAELIEPTIGVHNGRLVKTTGDGLLVEFDSVLDALRCATEVQVGIVERNVTAAGGKRIEFRIGINVGDIVVEDDDIFGDAVNVAARLEALADPGGICVSARVQEDAAGKLNLAFEDMGDQSLKNIERAVRTYRVIMATGSASTRAGSGPSLPDKPSAMRHG